jgi:transcriptional regulator GlxA family with amidase domain
VLGLNFRYLRRFQDLDSTEDLAYLLDTILGRFMRLAFTLKTVKHATAIKKALKFIRERYGSQFTLADAAEAADLSPAYFSKVFKSELGESFSEHVNRLRIERAVILLTGSDLSLAEIAGKVGFEDQATSPRCSSGHRHLPRAVPRIRRPAGPGGGGDPRGR